MQTKQEQISPCEIMLEIEVEKDKVDSAFEATYKELAKAAKIPGFRKGKAPKPVLQQYLDEDKVKERAAERLIEPAYAEALKETKLEPFGAGSLEMVKFEAGEPLVFKATVPLRPQVELGEYVGLEVERKVRAIEDSHLEAEINDLLERYAEYAPVTDRPVAEGDHVVVDVKDNGNPDEETKRQTAEVGKNIPEFDKAVVGMKIDEEKTIQVKYPDDHPSDELKGKEASLSIKVIEIQEKKLPELTDEWVKKMFGGEQEPEGKGKSEAKDKPDAIDTVDKLRSRIREAMEKAAQESADAGARNDIVKLVVESSEVEYPSVMVKERVNERMAQMLSSLKEREVTLDDYLKHVGKTAEELRSEHEEEEKRMLTTSLVLHEIKEKESIEVEDKDVDAEIEQIAGQQRVPPATIRAYIDRTNGMEDIKARVLHKKVMDFLVGASNIKNVGQ